MQASPCTSPTSYLGWDEIDRPIGNLSSAISSSLSDLFYAPVPLAIVTACLQPSAFGATPAQPSLAEPRPSKGNEAAGTIYGDFDMKSSLRQEGARLLEEANFEDLIVGSDHHQLMHQGTDTGAYRPSALVRFAAE